jgi:hypothetical protein
MMGVKIQGARPIVEALMKKYKQDITKVRLRPLYFKLTPGRLG